MGGYGTGLSAAGSQGTGKNPGHALYVITQIHIKSIISQCQNYIVSTPYSLAGVISPGLSVPLQVPGQTHDLTSNYWPRL